MRRHGCEDTWGDCCRSEGRGKGWGWGLETLQWFLWGRMSKVGSTGLGLAGLNNVGGLEGGHRVCPWLSGTCPGVFRAGR